MLVGDGSAPTFPPAQVATGPPATSGGRCPSKIHWLYFQHEYDTYILIYIYTHIYILTILYIYMYVYILINIYIYVICVHYIVTHSYLYDWDDRHAFTYIYIYIYIYICIVSVCVCLCFYSLICVYSELFTRKPRMVDDVLVTYGDMTQNTTMMGCLIWTDHGVMNWSTLFPHNARHPGINRPEACNLKLQVQWMMCKGVLVCKQKL